jgi:hypothetical protein
MEPHPHMFVSKSSTDDWVPDPDVPGSHMHELVHADGVWPGSRASRAWMARCRGRLSSERSR